MKRRKLWIWVLGVVIAAGVAAFVRYRAGGDVVVQLVDNETGKPVTKAVVKIQEYYKIPGLSALRFLPPTIYSGFLEREINAPRGEFRMRRISENGADIAFLNVVATGFEAQRFVYHGRFLSSHEQFGPGTRVVIDPPVRIRLPPEGPLVVPLTATPLPITEKAK